MPATRTYPKVKQPDHPLAPPRGLIAIHRMLLYDRIGPGPHACHWCGTPINWAVGHKRKVGILLTDHVDGNRTNYDPSNLVPSCNSCNLARAHPERIGDNELTVLRGAFRTRADLVTCAECGVSFAKAQSNRRSGKQDFCSRTCSVAAAHRANQTITPDELTVTVSDGARIKRLRAVQRTCEQCGGAFTVSQHRVTKGFGRFCGRSCSVRHQHATGALGK